MKKIGKIGKIYKGNLKTLDKNANDEELIFLVIRKISPFYEALKISREEGFKFGVRLKNEKDEIIVLQITNNFYLTSEEIEKFEVIDEVSEKDLEKILSIRKNLEYTAECKKTEEEFRKIKEFHMRIFEILSFEE